MKSFKVPPQLLSFQPYVFTEMEVVNLWNTFKLDFPEDSINKLQMTELVKRIFPRFGSEN